MGIGPGSHHLKSVATYWAPGSTSDDYGESGWADPILVNCRWVIQNEEVVDKNGEQIVSHSHVYVDRDLIIGGMIVLGDFTAPAEPNPNSTEAQEVQAFNVTPDLRSMNQLRKAFL